MAGATYHLDRAAFRVHLLNAPWMVAEMRSRAEVGKTAAEAEAPVDESSPTGGRYKASFRVESGTQGGLHHDRAYGRLSNGSPEAVYVEFGNGKEGTAQFVLLHAMDAMR